MIKFNNLTKYFGEKKVLQGINFDILDGESLAIIGPSGCGKSTLLRLILRIEEPTAGSISINGRDISRLNEDQLIAVREKIGMVFQSGALFDSLTVFENVAFALREHAKLSEREVARVVREKLKLVELEGTENLMPDELSGGMQKRVGIARALAFDPAIILYDEPTTGLDPITSVNIENLMVKLSRELKATSIVVTHVMQTVYKTAKRIVMLHEGRFIEVGSPEEAQKARDPVVRKFITGGKE
ncbi:ABC transporter ATP-binding protein [candidate division WOR-1 bacterium RIFCSPHIGHO2_01_FULL_53_15]|uniref:ABC transporter ATP-binding protein n=1 Tax=candidate division WOR-1 bacterium RIFCSPHIGHO2_01_FULL_53_15 TaxID=1802564 RepID=A0A1F4PZU8_UNCSA|nr:MAG: ABC transporter ATP-binding protein [candidate division WOR-1 bacterium RIFCSPHIGHO2_01_FULL_53_15]OGC10788.1 MAG: ABC transporter ATP-binding protein [candidate division WOR-1 bacterium RIFCSPHIGHO2_02_FULL_53_26]